MKPNRIASYLAAAAALLGGAAPVVADLDVTSTAGITTGVIGVLVVFREWLKGWRDHEWRSGNPVGFPPAE